MQRRLLTFVIIGGGATGVELAGAVAEISRHALAHDFRSIHPETARVILIEGGPDVLSTYVPTLSAFKGTAARARPSLAARGVGRVVAGGPGKPASRKATARAAAAPVDRDRYIFNDVLRRTGAVVSLAADVV